MITYDYYRIFYYVAQYKSFTKAARALHNNQPNITRCMNNLEQELKCTLFLRSNKGIALTPEGRQLYEHVALAFEQLSIGEEEIRQNGELEHGLVSIGASENALRLILLEKLELFREQYPHVRLRLFQPFYSPGCTGTEKLCGGFRYCHHSDLHPQAFTEKKSPALPGDPCMRKQI